MINKSEFLKPIAHRGLHNEKEGLIENSSGAFIAAINKGYGIECDVRPIQEGLPVLFHDKTLDRLIGTQELLANLSNSDLKKVRYRTGGEKILTLKEFLAIVSGRVPILVEVKSDWRLPNIKFLSEIARLSLEYIGPLALMSFDPDIMTVLRELAVEIPRGIVSGGVYDPEGKIWADENFDTTRIPSLVDLVEINSIDLSFYACEVHSLPNNERLRYLHEIKGIPIFAWTVRTLEELAISNAFADAPIFEGFEP